MSENGDSDSDPFEKLERDVADREGDPFETLPAEDSPDTEGTDGEESAETDSEETAMNAEWTDEFGVQDGPRESVAEGQDNSGTSDRDSTNTLDENLERDGMNLDVGRRPDTGSDPLADVGQREGDPFERGDSLFEQRETDEIDPDQVWQDLASADSRGAVEDRYERNFAEVSKHSYCEQCEHFSPPPAVTCNHEGTDIVEFLDMETIRVVDCPIVAERKKLQDE